ENLIDGLLPEAMARPQYGGRSSVLKPEASVSWELKPGYAFGGYGKCPPQLQQFISASYATNQVPLEPVYTAKAMAALCALSRGQTGGNYLFIHSGGLQGRRGFC
ncbi:MAG: hypothetical protein OIF35_08425, partial [Cellvibrionaceae bacterium]|nr:hypothetical protein [Cellvibrionaceae bacterium]